jgi:hypothetical protein
VKRRAKKVVEDKGRHLMSETHSLFQATHARKGKVIELEYSGESSRFT